MFLGFLAQTAVKYIAFDGGLIKILHGYGPTCVSAYILPAAQKTIASV